MILTLAFGAAQGGSTCLFSSRLSSDGFILAWSAASDWYVLTPRVPVMQAMPISHDHSRSGCWLPKDRRNARLMLAALSNETSLLPCFQAAKESGTLSFSPEFDVGLIARCSTVANLLMRRYDMSCRWDSRISLPISLSTSMHRVGASTSGTHIHHVDLISHIQEPDSTCQPLLDFGQLIFPEDLAREENFSASTA